MNKLFNARLPQSIALSAGFCALLCLQVFVTASWAANQPGKPAINDNMLTILRAKEASAFHYGVSAYLWGYSLVRTERLQRDRIFQSSPGVPQAALNQFGHVRKLRDAKYKKIPTPNNDTIYSHAFLDLRNEPVVITVPEIKNRYYVLPLLSAYQEVFASIGTRETQGRAGSYAIVGPEWQGVLPNDLIRIDSPTNMLIVWGRVVVNGPKDLTSARAIQDSFELTPLSKMSDSPRTLKPDWNESKKRAKLTEWSSETGVPKSLAFFYELGEAMKLTKLRSEDTAMVEQFRAIGLTREKGFAMNTLDNATIMGLSRSVAAAELMIDGSASSDGRLVNGWFFNNRAGIFGNDFLFRAAVAKWYAAANEPKEAMYYVARTTSNGKPFNGADSYSLHFDEPPPADAFWSLSMYNSSDGSFVDNAIDRYSLGDRTEGFKGNDDGSIDISIQRKEPPKGKANWLPAPEGQFYLVLRLYMPDKTVVSGKWTPPAVKMISN